MSTTGTSPETPSLRVKLRKSLPFLIFILVFTVYVVYLQLQFQDALAQLLLVRVFFQIAVAALVIAVLKNVLGLRTIGTFAPAIIAIAFLATGLFLGLALLGIILFAVVVVRRALAGERIQSAHRVAILVTTVSVSISTIAVLGLEFGQHELFFSILFPILINAWMGEEYVEQTARVGWKSPTIGLAATVGTMVVSFLVISQDALINFVITNPLSWLALVLVNWYLGTHVRFRIGDRFRFWGPLHYRGDDPAPGDFGDDILTIIMRNRDFVDKYNPPSLLNTLTKDRVKALLVPLGVPMARTYLTIEKRNDLSTLSSWLATHSKFALKPASGFGGEGILLAKGSGYGGIYNTNMGVLETKEIENHALSIIDGEFHDGRSDTAMVEELLDRHESVESLAPIGLADFRLICLLGFPVMAMMRIPTKASGGKANLHQGAIAAGIQLSTGVITHSILHGDPKPFHPDTNERIIGKKVPFWDEILEIASEAQTLSGLGFAGVDVTLDARQGPVLMEVNRRPGLEIQNANAAGLLRRLKLIESLPKKERPVEDRLAIAKTLDQNNWQASPVIPISQPPHREEEEEFQSAPESQPRTTHARPPILSLPFDFYSGRKRAFKTILIILIVLTGSIFSLTASGSVNINSYLGPHVQNSEWAFLMTGARQLAAQGYTGRGVTVCIVDTGIDPFHPDLANAHINAWWDLVNFHTRPYDDKGHGTAMAGLIVAQGALQGGAPGVQLIIIKALDSLGRGSPENVANGIHLCVYPRAGRQSADIISLSLGSSHIVNSTIADNSISAAVTWATAQGVLVVASAGNDGQRDDGDVEVPAREPLSIGVGAVDIDGHRAPFTSIGNDFNQTDPNLKPEIAAPGVRLVSTGTGARYTTVTGTSPAAAIVTANLALILEARPCLRSKGNSQSILTLKTALAKAARKIPGQQLPHDPWTGYGIMDAPATLENIPQSCNAVEPNTVTVSGLHPPPFLEMITYSGRPQVRPQYE